MSRYPEDIMETAEGVWLEANDLIPTDAIFVIADAILAERERNERLSRELGIQRMMFGAGLVMIGMAGLSYAGAF